MSLPYSNLEVRGVEDYNAYDNNGGFKEAADQSDYSGLQVIYHSNERDPSAICEAPARTTRICGLSRRVFYLIIVIVLFVIIGAIAGGVAGGLSNTHKDPTAADNPTTADVPSQESKTNISRLTSSNQTDSKGYTYQTVFFQDPHNAIIARMWDSQNKTWTASNLTEIMRGSTTPLNPLPGTPLASASDNNETHLYFLDPDNHISGIYLDTAAMVWRYDLSLGDHQIPTLQGSQLAAMWQRCTDNSCGGHWILAYQTPAGDISVANSSTNWDSQAVALNSSLSLAPKLNGGLGGADWAILISEAISSKPTSDMQKTTFSGEWVPDGLRITNIPLPSPKLQFTIALMSNFTQTMQLALLPNGTVTAMWWGNHQYLTIPSINFRGGPEGVNFTAIAVSEDTMLYGVFDDQILEYKPYDNELSSFVYSGTVYP